VRRHADALLADALTIAVKTVGIHVSHILRKLDFPTRVQAAAIAHRVRPRPRLAPPNKMRDWRDERASGERHSRRPAWTTSRSAGRDCCSATKPAVSGALLDPRLTAPSDDG
jgi:hypothetical protein